MRFVEKKEKQRDTDNNIDRKTTARRLGKKGETKKRGRTCESDDGEAHAIDGDAAAFVRIGQDGGRICDGQLHACLVVVIVVGLGVIGSECLGVQ